MTETYNISVDQMLWVCENCPKAAGTLERIASINFATFQPDELWMVRFDTDENPEELAWFKLKYLK